jgi:hypothetical protein
VSDLSQLYEVMHPKAKIRRDGLRAAKLCINGGWFLPRKGQVVHGPVVSGGKCQRCLDVKARTP